MEILHTVLDLFLHLDIHLASVIQQYGAWTYGILFLIIFCETGLVVTPFLPGDSLLFASGSLAALGALHLFGLAGTVILAAFLGDVTNYSIGRFLGKHLFHGNSKLLNRKYLDRTHAFYEKHGSKALIMARFVPVVRTFAPFVAGLGRMRYARFLSFSIVASLLWVSVCVCAGFLFGNIPVVKKNFSLVILVIIFVSFLPMIIGVWRNRSPSERTKSFAD